MAESSATPDASRVVTVVLNYQNVEDTVACVRSLRDSDFSDQQILVVDNAEAGENADALRSALDPAVAVLSSGGNLGYAGGNNVGIRWALERRPEFIWIVNPDAVAKRNTLSGLVRAAESHPDAGIIGCRILVGDSKPARIESNGGRLDATNFGQPSTWNTGQFDREVPAEGVRDVEWVSGACSLLRVAMIDEAGLLPEDYFLYFEDTDYCERVRQHGWRTVVATGVRVWHFKRSGRELPTAANAYYMTRNRVLFAMRHFGANLEDFDEHDPRIEGWRTKLNQLAPERLEAYDDLVRRAFADARAGRVGRTVEVESVDLSPDSSPAHEVARLSAQVERERRQGTRDARRLLDRLDRDKVDFESRTKELRQKLEAEQRLRRNAEQELVAEQERRQKLRARLDSVLASRSYRFGRAASRLAHPLSTARAALRR